MVFAVRNIELHSGGDESDGSVYRNERLEQDHLSEQIKNNNCIVIGLTIVCFCCEQLFQWNFAFHFDKIILEYRKDIDYFGMEFKWNVELLEEYIKEWRFYMDTHCSLYGQFNI
jgi:hypothetical protein